MLSKRKSQMFAFECWFHLTAEKFQNYNKEIFVLRLDTGLSPTIEVADEYVPSSRSSLLYS